MDKSIKLISGTDQQCLYVNDYNVLSAHNITFSELKQYCRDNNVDINDVKHYKLTEIGNINFDEYQFPRYFYNIQETHMTKQK